MTSDGRAADGGFDRVSVRPSALTTVELPLTPDGDHVWRPFAPSVGH